VPQDSQICDGNFPKRKRSQRPCQILLMVAIEIVMKKSAQRDVNTLRALAVVRFGHRPLPASPLSQTHRQDRLQYTAPQCIVILIVTSARSVINSPRGAQHFSLHPAGIALPSKFEVMLSISTWGAASSHCRPYHRFSTYATTCWWYTPSNLCWETPS